MCYPFESGLVPLLPMLSASDITECYRFAALGTAEVFTFARYRFHARKLLSSSRNSIQVHKSNIKGHIGIKNDVTGSGVHYKCMQYGREGLASVCH